MTLPPCHRQVRFATAVKHLQSHAHAGSEIVRQCVHAPPACALAADASCLLTHLPGVKPKATLLNFGPEHAASYNELVEAVCTCAASKTVHTLYNRIDTLVNRR